MFKAVLAENTRLLGDSQATAIENWSTDYKEKETIDTGPANRRGK
jgi:hypothetical protein